MTKREVLDDAIGIATVAAALAAWCGLVTLGGLGAWKFWELVLGPR